MNSYGIKGPLIKWFEHYLYQRKQKVINRATSSTVCEVSAEVPQGSVLKPNVKLKLYLTSVLKNNIISVLSGLKDINHFVDQVPYLVHTFSISATF
jgi:hypothetical protein